MADDSEAQSISSSVSAESSTGENRLTLDITFLLTLATKDLGKAELIHGEDFNSWLAMAAVLEINQLTHEGLISTNYNPEEAISIGPVTLSCDKTENVLSVIDVMDHILACEATWHAGATMPGTDQVYFYTLTPETVSSHVLLDSFFRVTMISCDAVNSVLGTSYSKTVDEHKSYYRSSESSQEEEFLSILEAAEKKICFEQLQTNPDLEAGLCQALNCRLRFRKHFFSVLSCMRRPRGKGLYPANEHIEICLDELDSMLTSEDFLRSSSSCRRSKVRVEPTTTASGCQPVGFRSSINRPLVARTSMNSRFGALARHPVVKLLSWKEAVDHFKKLLIDLRIICSNPLSPVLEDAVRFLTDFHKRQPGLVATSHIQALLVQDGKLYGREPIIDVICKAARLPERVKCHAIMKNKTVEKLGELLLSLLRTLAGNRSLQRRMLGKILQYWQLIIQELDSAFRAEYGDLTRTATNENEFNVNICKHILAWATDQKHWITLRFLFLGFDLELYSPSDFCMVYWYIFAITRLLAEEIKLKRNESFKTNAENRKLMNGEQDDVPPEVMVLYHLAEGLYVMFGVLRIEHGVFLCEEPFNSEEERFTQHFEQLQDAGYFSYSSFKADIDCARLAARLSRNQSFMNARKIARKLCYKYEKDEGRLDELTQIVKIANCNEWASDIVRVLHNPARPIMGCLCFGYHPHLVAVTLQYVPESESL